MSIKHIMLKTHYEHLSSWFMVLLCSIFYYVLLRKLTFPPAGSHYCIIVRKIMKVIIMLGNISFNLANFKHSYNMNIIWYNMYYYNRNWK